jgi:putative ABC transport system substrate-binding protein
VTRTIGVLSATSENDAEGKVRLHGFTQALQQLGYIDGANIRFEVRWAEGQVDRMRTLARELVDRRPSLIIASTTAVVTAILKETHTIPIVFVIVSDPIGEGFVETLAHPGKNVTGFIDAEGSMGGKWVELITKLAPAVRRVAVMFNPETAPGHGLYFLPSIEAAARGLNVDPLRAPIHNESEIERVIAGLARPLAGGLMIMPDGFPFAHRTTILMLAAKYNVPSVYPIRTWAEDGGMASYGADYRDLWRRSASYVDRILRGESPAVLPVQLPIKFETILNAKTIAALGLTVPETLLATADEVIQ